MLEWREKVTGEVSQITMVGCSSSLGLLTADSFLLLVMRKLCRFSGAVGAIVNPWQILPC